jgi:hypothetical protein
MRKGIGHDIALALSLQAVMADGGRGLHRRLHIPRFDESPLFFGVVGLQLNADLKLICFDFVHSALRFLHLGRHTEQVLHAMAHLVRDHVSLRELRALAPAATKAPLNISEEGGVNGPIADCATPQADRVTQRT